ncbi:MAG: hypothetical protein MUE46_10795 [Xanthomonadales bacterium]|jgi:hypothetical protein|nr:hypothetical protein [Xanthomonadales bacterium]
MTTHTPYSVWKRREADFVVDYELDPCDELKSAKPCQGMRVDFLYEGDDPKLDGIHMIWPELLDSDGQVILEVAPGLMEVRGRANMWIVDDRRRSYHAARIKVGARGYWVRGGYRLARVAVVEVLSLRTTAHG